MAGRNQNGWFNHTRTIILSVITAVIVGVGGALASHETRISKIEGSMEKIDLIYDDVKTIKDLLIEKGLE